MLENIRPGEVLFLDIETVSGRSHYDELTTTEQLLWEEKSRFIRERKQIDLTESYSESAVYAEFGKVICISVWYFHTEESGLQFRSQSFYGDDEKALLDEFAALLNKCTRKPFKMLCAHNGKEFDFPYIARRMLVKGVRLPQFLDFAGKKPWEIPHLDTMELWKFGDYKHYTSLRLLAHLFGIPSPKEDIDGSRVGEVYYREGDLGRIEKYCRRDVATIAALFLAYRGEAWNEVFEPKKQ